MFLMQLIFLDLFEDVMNFMIKIKFILGGVKFGKLIINDNVDENENLEYLINFQKNFFGC